MVCVCRGISHEKLGQFEEAVADFSEVVRLEPDNVNAYFSRGSALDSLGRFEKAVEDYTKALVLDSSVVGGSQQAGPAAQEAARQQIAPQTESHLQLASKASAMAAYYSPLVAGLSTAAR